MLRAAAVIGDAVDVDLLSAVTRLDVDDLADLLDEAADEDVLTTAPDTGRLGSPTRCCASGCWPTSPPRRQQLHLASPGR